MSFFKDAMVKALKKSLDDATKLQKVLLQARLR
jgi:hypothetical protein